MVGSQALATALRTLTKEAIRRHVAADAYGDIRRLFDEHGHLRPITSLSAEDAALIAGWEVIIKNAAAGDGHTLRVPAKRFEKRLPLM